MEVFKEKLKKYLILNILPFYKKYFPVP